MKIGMVSLGCPKNLVDSEVMLGLAQKAGPPADARRRRRRGAGGQHLRLHRQGQAGVDRHHPRDGRAQEDGRLPRLVVTGCMAERYRDELRAQIPEIDAILGTGEVPEIVNALGIRDSGLGTRTIPLLRANGEPVNPGARVPNPGSLPDVPLRRGHAAAAGDAPPLRLHQDRRGLRLQVRASASSRRCAATIAADRSTRSCRRRSARRARRQGTAAHLAGHELLRHRPGRARRAGAAAARAATASTASSGSGCSTSTPPRSATTCWRRWRRATRCAATSICRCSTRPTRC